MIAVVWRKQIGGEALLFVITKFLWTCGQKIKITFVYTT
jgi:hypothetical protein